MPSLQVREVPEHLYKKLQLCSAKSHRSLAQETISLLEKALSCKPMPVQRRQALLKKIAESDHFSFFNDKEMPGPADMLREDRDR